jgi:hypothetical protein
MFTLGGIIHVNPGGYRISNPFITIAGQTAPGGGIVLQGDLATTANTMLTLGTHDIIIRYITIAPGFASNAPGPSSGSTGIAPNASAGPQATTQAAAAAGGGTMADHLSIRWTSDKPWLVNDNGNGSCGNDPQEQTLQWTMLYEPNSGHPVGPGVGATSGFAPCEWDNDFHHNLFATISHRIPTYYGATGRWQDNITWNWQEGSGGGGFGFVGEGGSKVDVINNYLKAGNLNAGGSCNIYEFDIDNDNNPGDFDNSPFTLPYVGNQYYFSGNVGPHQANPNGNQLVMVGFATNVEGGGCPSSPPPGSALRSAPLVTQPFPITQDPANNLPTLITPTVGNSQGLADAASGGGVACTGVFVNRRDGPDTRIIGLFQNNGSDNLYPATNSPPAPPYNQPGVAAGSPCPMDSTGLYLAWKAKYGVTAAGNAVDPVTGLTFLEDMLDNLVP